MRIESSSEILKWKEIIERKARDFNLDFYDVIFEMVDYKEINELAALGGFPQRYPHWRFGMDYEKLETHATYGLSKIYEMVINNDPCYAYLLSSNRLLEQKLVMAHVYGHADFFKNNRYFAYTDRKMLDTMANHAVRVRKYQKKYGVEVVEEFIDQVLSLDNLIDTRLSALAPKRVENKTVDNKEDVVHQVSHKPYLEKFVKRPQPPKPVEPEVRKRFPERPERDVLLFLMENAPLESWQQDIVSIIRAEAIYFAPQAQTKIMNEGWASYWHSKIMTTTGVLWDSELIDYADVHAGTMAIPPNGINPYRIGIELFRDIEDRWNRGAHGKEWEECDDIKAKQNWDKKTGQGLQKIFEVRKVHSDLTFIDTFLTEDFCRRQKLFNFSYNPRNSRYEIQSREFKQIKEGLLKQLTNFGQPIIEVVDANHMNRGELLLKHFHEGVDLRLDYAQLTMKNLSKIWGRPVNIQTVVEEKPVVLSFDGQDFKTLSA